MTTLILAREFHAGHEQALAELCDRRGVRLDVLHLPETIDALPPVDVLAGADAFFLSRDIRFSQTLFPIAREVVGAAPRLRWLHFASSGASQHKWLLPKIAAGLTVTTSIGNNAEPLAQSALMGLLMLGRPGMMWVRNQRAHDWVQLSGSAVPADIAGQTIVIVGLGSIGRHLARMVLALRMRVIGVRRSPRNDEDPQGVELATPDALPALAREADWIVFCLPATGETRGMLSRELLWSMKPGAHVINVARGDVADEDALYQALATRRIAGAYLDVFREEPLPATSPFWDLPNVLVSPHNASVSAGNNRRATEIFFDNLVRFARGEALRNVFTP